jgi:hypothetical protein
LSGTNQGVSSGITLHNMNNVIRDVTIRNIYSPDGTNEGFGILMMGTNALIANCTIIGTKQGRMHSGSWGYSSAVGLSGYNSSMTGCIIDMQDYTYDEYNVGLGIGACGCSTISGCIVRNTQNAFSMDNCGLHMTYPGFIYGNTIISGNYLQGNAYAIRIHPNTNGYGNMTWIGNIIESTNRWIDNWNYSTNSNITKLI